jgi:YVTN family beta-propeller protein
MNANSRSALSLLAIAALTAAAAAASHAAGASAPAVATVPGMPPVVDPTNLYSETGPGHVSPALKDDLVRVYVPNLRGNSVSVIDPATMKVVDTFKVGQAPQHVVVGYDLRTLWAANNAERSSNGSLTPIDPRTGKPGKAIPVDDPYNMYFTPDGKSAIVVAEAKKRLDFRDRLPCSTRSTRRSAAASTTPTSPSTAAPRSSRASSTARSPGSTWWSARWPATSCCRCPALA